MGAALQVLEWANYLLTCLWLGWFALTIIVGGVVIALGERRLRLEEPKPTDVQAYANEMFARHGTKAFHVVGQAMVDVRAAKNYRQYRFLREVSNDLVSQTQLHDFPQLGIWPERMTESLGVEQRKLRSGTEPASGVR